MSELGIGIIGSGFMGRTYAETISKYCRGARLVAVTGGSRAEALATDYAITLEASVASLVKRDDIHAVFVTTPHHVHAEHALAAAEAGKHLLIEKPMAHSVDACDAILSACEKNNVNCSVAYSQRYRTCNIAAKRLIDEGAIGPIRAMQEFALVPLGLGGMPKWQSDAENLGILFGHGVHNFDRIRWFTGREIQKVYAKCGNLVGEANVEGTSSVVMTLDDGTTANFWCSYEVPAPSFPMAAFRAWVIGERGLMDVDAYGDLRVSRDGVWEVAATQSPIDWQGKGFLDPVRLESYTLHCQEVIDCAAEGRPTEVTGHDGRQAVAAALAAYESSKTGREVVLK
jgi:predicted dehydrogenase